MMFTDTIKKKRKARLLFYFFEQNNCGQINGRLR